MELGSQDFWCPRPNLIRALFAAFGGGEPAPELLPLLEAGPASVLPAELDASTAGLLRRLGA